MISATLIMCHYYIENRAYFDLNIPVCHIRYTSLSTIYGTAQRQSRKRTQLFCNLRVRIECNECVLSMRTSLDFRIL